MAVALLKRVEREAPHQQLFQLYVAHKAGRTIDMSITKSPSFFCEQLKQNVVLDLTYVSSPGNVLPEVLTKFISGFPIGRI